MANGLLIESISQQAFTQIEEFKGKLVESLKAAEGLATATQKIKLPSELKTQFSETEKQAGKTKKVVSDYEKQVRSLENTQKKLMQSTNSISRAEKKLKEEIRLGNKHRKDEITLATNAANAYERLQAKYNIAYRNLQNLSAAGKQSTSEFRRAQNVFAKYEARVTRADHAVKSFRRNVGNYPKTMGAATASLRNLMSAFGLFTGVFLFAQLMRNAVNSVRLFDASMQNIAGVMRTTRDKIKDLEEVIISVAGASVNTATQVAKLAEALITLGKTKEDIKDLLEPVNNLAIGLETTGKDAAEFLVQTLNAFGASSKEAGQYADTIATIRTSTTLDFQKMRDSFQFLTPISRILNKDLAWTGSVLGVLADNGLKAESAGRLLGTAIQKLAKNGKTLQQGLDEINTAYKNGVRETDLLALATKLFDKQAAKVGIILAKNSDLIDVNAEAIRNNGGALDDLVNEQLKSLDASLKILRSRWEEYILNNNEAGGASEKLGAIIRFLGDNLGTILNTIIAVVGSWALYKGAMLIATIATRVQTVALVQQRIAAIALSGGVRGVTRAIRLFAASLNITPLGLFATALGLVITAVVLLGKSTKVTNKDLKESIGVYKEKAEKTKELKNEIQNLKNRYVTLSEEVKTNKDKEEELEAVMKRLVTLVPQAEKEFNSFGKTLGLNTGTIDDYVKELSDLEEINNKIELDKNIKFLGEQRRVLNQVIELEKGGNKVRIESIGLFKKLNGELFQVQEITGQGGGDALTKTTLNQRAAIKQLSVTTRENIQATEDRLAVLRGGKTTAQQLKEQDEKDIQNKKEQTFIIQKLRREIRGHNVEIKNLTKNGVEKLTEAQGDSIVKEREAIKTKQALIDKILGFAKATNKAQKAIKGTINHYQELIALEEKNRDATATTAEEYEGFEKRISALRFELNLLNGEYDKWLDSLGKPTTEAEALKALKDELGKVKEEIVDINDVEEVDLDFLWDDDDVERVLAYRRALESVNELVKKSFVDLGATLGLRESTVTSLFDGIKDGFEDAGDAAIAFGALATDVINGLAQAQNARIDQQIERLGQEKDIAIAFAGESTEARARIEERYQERVNQLKEQQARNERRAAIISAIINTASAVVKTFAQLGFPAGIPAAAIITALGAAQVAVIASQPLPQFEKGVENFEGGPAIINEKRNEIVTTPDGKIMRPTGRNLLVNLPKGANVYSSEQAFQKSLNSTLGSNGIDPVGASSMANPIIIGSLGNSGLNAEDLKRALIETLGNRPVLDLNIDKGGITTTIHRQSTRAKILNNRVTVKSVNV